MTPEMKALGMLLDASWFPAHKVFARYRLSEGPPYWRYWDRTGKELPRDPKQGWPRIEGDG